MAVFDQRILILCKTYPSPSGKYVETSCVAGVLPNGELIRLFPVPFRLIKADQQFKKWQWISAKIEKARADHRPESFQIKVDTVQCDPGPISTKNRWIERRKVIAETPTFELFSKILQANDEEQTSLALLRPARILELIIEPVSHSEWTEDEIGKLMQQQRQGTLFEERDNVELRTLKKLPYSFYYRYECEASDGVIEEWRHKISDWEAGALYWNCVRNYGNNWEEKFRTKMFDSMVGRDMIFLMGNIHRFQKQWLIVSLLYPPRSDEIQKDLFG
ncbi:MAG: hypothetical protein VX195_08345 [Pseudomonadota bacterium]|nr:hypothetical protein [Pseudomonadota bacterium]|tara:strand:+ start:848 stop:1672 length:825 start_codon:yes stop_codon:yes gene_type:complete